MSVGTGMRTGRATVAAAALVVGVSLTGCSIGGSDHKASSSPASTISSAKGSSSAKATGGATPGKATGKQTPVARVSLPPSVGNVVKKRKSIVMSTCAVAPGGWKAAGTASNSGTTAAKYTITVFFTNPKATVEGYAVTNVTVAPGKSASWTATGKFTAASGSLCVLRGVA
jgi:hypothetical protein